MANEKQIGGTHYQSAWQHWDIVEEYNIGYLESVATKYIMRHRRKNGIEDLQKALHFIDKLLSLHRTPRGSINMEAILEFGKVNKLSDPELAAVRLLFSWNDQVDLQLAHSVVSNMILNLELGNQISVKEGSFAHTPMVSINKAAEIIQKMLIGFDLDAALYVLAYNVDVLVRQLAGDGSTNSLFGAADKFNNILARFLTPDPDEDK